jgi:hypothetical protein
MGVAALTGTGHQERGTGTGRGGRVCEQGVRRARWVRGRVSLMRGCRPQGWLGGSRERAEMCFHRRIENNYSGRRCGWSGRMGRGVGVLVSRAGIGLGMGGQRRRWRIMRRMTGGLGTGTSR